MKHKYSNFRISAAGLIIAAVLTITGCGNIKLQPAVIKKLNITDMEYQKYAVYTGSDITGYAYFVYNLTSNGKNLVLHYSIYNLRGYETNIPSKLSDFSDVYNFDAEKGTTLNFTLNWSNYTFGGTNYGPFLIQTAFDYTNLLMKTRVLSWDGRQVKTEESRAALKEGFSYFSGLAIYPAIMRFLDPEKPGIIYLVVPGVMDGAMAGSFRVTGKEDIETPAGKFKTLKLSIVASDYFLENLLRSYMDNFIMWVDPETGLVVKVKLSGFAHVFALVDSGIWKDR